MFLSVWNVDQVFHVIFNDKHKTKQHEINYA